MTILGIAGSLRAGSHNAQLLRLAAEELPEGVELVVFDGLAEIPAFDQDLEDLAPDAVDAPEGRDRGGGRDPHRDTRVQRLDPGRVEERARLGLAPDRRVADPQEAGGGDRCEHERVRRGMGAARAEEGARRDGSPGARRRAAVAKADRALLDADGALLDGLARVASELVAAADVERIAA